MNVRVYPSLSNRDYGFFRVGGPGLANCMFIAARAYLLSQRLNCKLLRPTWERFGLGQFLRRERDKRLYRGLFRRESVLQTFDRLWRIKFSERISEVEGLQGQGVVEVDGLGCYFEDLLPNYQLVKSYFDRIMMRDALAVVPENMAQSVSVHVRLGDFPSELRVPIDWYVGILDNVRAAAGHDLDIQIFSDGSDGDLSELLKIPGARRVFYGNALADIVAISRTGLLVGSHSTFSGWGAFLGQVPSVFQRIDYGRILLRADLDCRIGETVSLPDCIREYIQLHFAV